MGQFMDKYIQAIRSLGWKEGRNILHLYPLHRMQLYPDRRLLTSLGSVTFACRSLWRPSITMWKPSTCSAQGSSSHSGGYLTTNRSGRYSEKYQYVIERLLRHSLLFLITFHSYLVLWSWQMKFELELEWFGVVDCLKMCFLCRCVCLLTMDPFLLSMGNWDHIL